MEQWKKKKKSCPRSWELNGLYACRQLGFHVASQFVGEHYGRSKKRRLSLKTSPVAEELLVTCHVTLDDSVTKERRVSKQTKV